MSNQESERVLALLKELSLLKELDSEYETGTKTETHREENRLRQQRQQEIGEEIKAIAEETKNSTTKPT